jgi:Icc-related predicted phosphoesterase
MPTINESNPVLFDTHAPPYSQRTTYTPIGNPQIGSGKKAIVEWLRAQRGE